MRKSGESIKFNSGNIQRELEEIRNTIDSIGKK